MKCTNTKTAPCAVANCTETAEFDSIFADGGKVCPKHAEIEVHQEVTC